MSEPTTWAKRALRKMCGWSDTLTMRPSAPDPIAALLSELLAEVRALRRDIAAATPILSRDLR